MVSEQSVAQTEERIGVQFEPLSAPVYDEVASMVRTMAESMGVDAPMITPPMRGVLRAPLTDGQRGVLNGIFEGEYAKEAIELQQSFERVPIVESGERMVSIADRLAQEGLSVRFSTNPFHAACGEYGGKSRIYYARAGFIDKYIVPITRALNSVGRQPQIEDSWRPSPVTLGLRRRRVGFILEEHAMDWSISQIIQEADSKTANRPFIAGHAGGAAVDFTIWTMGANPTQLDLGNTYGQGGAAVALKWPYVTQEQWKTRMMFASAVILSGATVYPYEDWHANSGDVFGGLDTVTGKVKDGYIARYGPILDFDRETGKVQPYAPDAYNKPFLSEDDIHDLMDTFRANLPK